MSKLIFNIVALEDFCKIMGLVLPKLELVFVAKQNASENEAYFILSI